MDMWYLIAIIAVSACGHGDASRVRRSSPEVVDRPSCKPGATKPPTQVNTTQRLRDLRDEMNKNAIQAAYIPMDDAHQSEYVSDYDKRIQFISGFQGSAGKVVVLADKAALWTDGRYFLQAEAELDCNWILMKQGEADVPSINEWLIEHLAANSTVGADPTTLSYDSWTSMETALSAARLTLAQSQGLVDEVWKVGRPPKPDKPLLVLGMQFSGESWADKVKRVRDAMTTAGVDAVVITALDENAWLFNLRGDDITYNPVFVSYSLVEKDKVSLYLINAAGKLTSEVRSHLNVDDGGNCVREPCVNVKDYDTFLADYRTLSQASSKIWTSPMSSYVVYSIAASPNEGDQPDSNRVHLIPSIVRDLKGIKNEVEIEGLRKCHIRDSAVVIEFVTMLEKQIQDGESWTELSASNELEKRRRAAENNKGLSFATISSSGPNGAIIHYKPSPTTDRAITTSDMYLLDSGGQYLDGTTDVTRTFHFGEPTDFEKEAYTRVLMGAIDLALAVWPVGTYGRDIDAFARGPLWSAGLNYRHGTGHGIGAFLNVHEGPGRINLGYRSTHYESPLYPHMFFSDEPGYYEDGKFGVRLETIVMTTEVETRHNFGDTTYIGFETFTVVPFEPNLINYDLLSPAQRKFINAYHKKCDETVGKLLLEKGNQEAYNWLKKRTAPIPEDPMYGVAQGLIMCPVLLFGCLLLHFLR